MQFSQSAAMNFVPIMARLVLAAAFIPAGWNKLFTDTTFEGPAAIRLIELGVAAPPAVPAVVSPPAVSGSSSSIGSVVMTFALAVAAEEAQPSTAPAPGSAPGPGPGASRPVDEPSMVDTSKIAPPKPAGAARVAPAGTSSATEPKVTVRSLHNITLAVDGAGWTFLDPPLQAWAAALTEFLGGVLLLVGLVSRVWGLGLACVMGVAFYLTSLDAIIEPGLFKMDIPTFNRVFCQLGLFVLGFGIFLTGPGALSLDRLLFTRRVHPPPPPQPRPATAQVVPHPRTAPPAG